MKMNKIAKVVLGVLTGVVIAMGVKVEAKADVAYVFENGTRIYAEQSRDN